MSAKGLRLCATGCCLALAIPALRAAPHDPGQETAPAPQEEPAIDRGEIARAVDEYLAASAPIQEPSPWERALARLSFYGDFRLRFEEGQAPGLDERFRERIRMRLGINYSVGDQVQVGARIVTGVREDPRSPYWTLGSGFEGIEISLDRAFVSWMPPYVPGFRLNGGKFNHDVYRNPVYGELVWDADVQPEGLSAVYFRTPRTTIERYGVVGGYYVYRERALENDDLGIGVLQLTSRFRTGRRTTVDAAVGYYGYGHVSDQDVVPGDATDYGILNPIATLTHTVGGEPLAFSGEYIRNLGVGGDANDGWALGVVWGEMARKNQWRLWYQYQQVGRDSVFRLLAQDDFLQSTNFRGHGFGANYQFTDAIGLHLWGLFSTLLEPPPGQMDDDFWRLRFDLNVKF